MPELTDLTGSRFGHLLVVQYEGGDYSEWLCECDCGIQVSVPGLRLRNGVIWSCSRRCALRCKWVAIQGRKYECPRCRRILSMDEFYLSAGAPGGPRGGRRTRVKLPCRKCRLEVNALPENRERKGLSQKAYIDRRRTMIDGKKRGPCSDCGEVFPPVCIDLDHVTGDKVKPVSALKGYSLQKLEREMAKCVPVCSNCHRIRTARRWLSKKHEIPESWILDTW